MSPRILSQLFVFCDGTIKPSVCSNLTEVTSYMIIKHFTSYLGTAYFKQHFEG